MKNARTYNKFIRVLKTITVNIYQVDDNGHYTTLKQL